MTSTVTSQQTVSEALLRAAATKVFQTRRRLMQRLAKADDGRVVDAKSRTK